MASVTGGIGREKSLRSVILRSILLGVGLFVIIALIGLYSLFNIYHAEFAERQRELSESYYHYVENCMNETSRFSLSIIADESVQQGLRALYDSTGARFAQARVTLQEAVTASVTDSSPYSYRRSLVVRDGFGYHYSYGGLILDRALQNSVSTLISQATDDGSISWFAMTWNERPYLALVRAIRESKNVSLNVLGYEAILVDFRSLLNQAESGPGGYAEGLETYLDGECFYRGEACPARSVRPAEDEPWQIETIDGTRYFVTWASFLGNRLTFVSYEDYARVSGVLSRAWQNLLILLGVLVTLCAGFFLMVTKRIFQQLERLTEAIKNAPAGDFRVTLDGELLRADGEVGVLARHFQSLMDRVDSLIHRELRGKLLAAQAQCRMLQAQIHPHFLYNTLETIHAMAERDGNKEIGRITMNLSRLVRATYRSSMYVPLRQEIALVREYLTIYRIRFGTRLSAIIDYDPDDDEIMLPQMTLQPLVENSIRYGLMKKMDKGIIRLRIRHKVGQLRITLFDNGTGFPEELVEAYNHLELGEEMEIHGYKNVIYRLKYTYGDAARATVRSREGHWTNLSIVIPDRLPETALAEVKPSA